MADQRVTSMRDMYEIAGGLCPVYSFLRISAGRVSPQRLLRTVRLNRLLGAAGGPARLGPVPLDG